MLMGKELEEAEKESANPSRFVAELQKKMSF